MSKFSRNTVEAIIELLIEYVDSLDPDPDSEPWLAGVYNPPYSLCYQGEGDDREYDPADERLHDPADMALYDPSEMDSGRMIKGGNEVVHA